jgi:septal ring factor EnvC (AmiA/AmiB activator)
MSRLSDSALAPGRLIESLAALPVTLEKLLEAIDQLHKELRKMNKEVTAMRKGMDDLSGKVSGLQVEFTQTREAVVDMSSDVHRMSDDVNHLVPSIEGLRDDLGRLPFIGRRRRGAEPAVANGSATVEDLPDEVLRAEDAAGDEPTPVE